MNLLSTVLLSGGSIIDLDGTMLVQMGIFFVTMIFLQFLVFKPMVALFDARDEAIDGAKDDAKRLTAEADDAGTTFDDEMRKVRAASQDERERLRREGHNLENTLLSKVQAETQGQLAEAEKKAEQAAEKVRREMQAKLPIIAHQIASKLLNREVK